MPGGTWRQRWREPGGGAELLRLAWPLVLSNSFWTLQLALDRIFLGWQSSEAVGAVMAAGILFWTPLCLFQYTANYATTFVAQYVGAGRPHRVGPAVWQGIYFALAGGLFFLILAPLSGWLVRLAGHASHLQELETVYLRTLCFAALPTLLTAAANSFFAGRGETRTILIVNAVGLAVTAPLAFAWIFGYAGLPALGIEGAGWATVVGAWSTALTSLGLMVRPQHRQAFAILSGWRFDRDLFQRLMRFGLPNGIQVALDCLAFSLFVLLIGRLGPVELSATSMAFTLNMLVLLPALGIAQAVEVLVGNRLGEDKPDVAERTTWTALKMAMLFMGTVGLVYVLYPQALADLFHNNHDAAALPALGASTVGLLGSPLGQGPLLATSALVPDRADPVLWEQVRPVVPLLLRFVVIYLLFDCMNLVFSFALRGAGDTRFVTKISMAIAWPVMVLPTWCSWYYGWGLFWAWGFASTYIILLAFTFLLRFRHGKWRTMRVIEAAPVEADADLAAALEDGQAAERGEGVAVPEKKVRFPELRPAKKKLKNSSELS